jgi:hypothetical protein
MTVAEILKATRFVVDQEGKPTAAQLDIEAWQAFLALLEEIEDVEVLRERLGGWPEKKGWTPWEEFAADL